jgi:hypothetical protein
MHKNASWPFDAEDDGWNRMHVALTLVSSSSGFKCWHSLGCCSSASYA